MSKVEERLKTSSKILKTAEVLIQSYVDDTNKVSRIQRDKSTDEFTIAFNGLIMLMSELDRARAIELLAKYKIMNNIRKSVKRIQNNKTMAFSY